MGYGNSEKDDLVPLALLKWTIRSEAPVVLATKHGERSQTKWKWVKRIALLKI